MSVLVALSAFATAPFVAILALLIHYSVKRAAWKRRRRRGKPASGFCPSSAALGVVFLFAQVFVRPSLDQMIEAVQHDVRDEDDEGDPDSPLRHFHRQLRRLRRGEAVDRLVLRLLPSAPSGPAEPGRPC
jgi:hypothetical protein